MLPGIFVMHSNHRTLTGDKLMASVGTEANIYYSWKFKREENDKQREKCKSEYRSWVPLSNDFSEMQNQMYNYEDSIPSEWKEKRKQRENDILYWEEEVRRKEAELDQRD